MTTELVKRLEEQCLAIRSALSPTQEVMAIGHLAQIVIDNRDTIIAALEAHEGMGWQGIETAPKDGTPVILAVAGNEFYPRSGWWETEFERWVVRVSMDGESATGLGIAPTHWRSLPAAPTTDKEG